jgi:predicted phosphohydrolase
MKLHLVSDIHSEQYSGKYLEDFITSLTTSADVLVLAGDIGTYRTLDTALDIFSKRYERVVFVPGNHEYYRSSFKNFNPILPENVHLLNPGTVRIGDVNFIGATLWTDFNNSYQVEHAAKAMINDFKVIEGFTTHQCSNLYHQHVTFLRQALDLFHGQKNFVVTHFSPTQQAISEYWKHHGGALNQYFHNDLDGMLMDLPPTKWAFGHTHDPIQLRVGEVDLYCNPLGYRGENDEYNQLIIEV